MNGEKLKMFIELFILYIDGGEKGTKEECKMKQNSAHAPFMAKNRLVFIE